MLRVIKKPRYDILNVTIYVLFCINGNITTVLNIQLLGAFQVSYNNEPVKGLESPRLKSLLAYLVLHPGAPQLRQHIAFIFWPDSTEAQARTNLRGLIYSLHKVLPDYEVFIEVSRQSIQWRAESPFLLDVADFRRGLEAAQSTSELKEAISFYSGELMRGFYDDWIMDERELLRAEFSEGLESLVMLLEEERDHRSAVRYIRRLVREEPYSEKNYLKLMQLYVQIGDRASALSVYQSCVQILRDELGVEISSEIQVLYDDIVGGETATLPVSRPPDLPRMDNLPLQLTSFVGRQLQLAQVGESLLAGRLLTITGTGGSGKTRLALQSANEVAESFSDGVWMTELTSLSSTGIPRALASILKVRDQPNGSLMEGLVAFLSNKSLLLILDNCEHLLRPTAELVVAILQSCPRVHVLATSRERLNIPGERVHLLAPLSFPESGSTEMSKIKEAEAVQLFVDRATSILPTFVLDENNAQAVAHICSRLDGIPLAIELAAARARLFSPSEMVTRLDDTFRLLSGGSQVAPPRQQTLLATMDWSYELLSKREKILLHRLAIFAGGWTLDAAENVTADNDERGTTGPRNPSLEEADVLENLARLIDKSLVVVDSQSGIARYRLLETIQEYVTSKLVAAGEVDQLQERYFNYYLEFAAKASSQLNGPEQVVALSRLLEERDNLNAALHWAQDSDRSEICLRLSESLHDYWVKADRVVEGREWIEQSLAETGEAIEPDLLAGSLYCLGVLLYIQGDYTTADQHVRNSQNIYEDLGDKRGVGQAVLTEGTILWHRGRYEEAQARFEQSLRLFREIRDTRSIAEAHHLLGHIDLEQQDRDGARARFEKSLTLFREYGDIYSVTLLEGDLGLLAYLLEEFNDARIYYEENLIYFREVDSRDGIARTLNRLGDLARCQGNYAKAETVYKESLALGKKLEIQSHKLSALHNLGYVSLNQHKLEQSAELFVECLKAYDVLEDRKGIAESLAGIAGVSAASGQLERAARLFGTSQRLLDAMGTEPWPANRIEVERSLVLLRKGMDDENFRTAQEAGRQMNLSEAVEDALDFDL